MHDDDQIKNQKEEFEKIIRLFEEAERTNPGTTQPIFREQAKIAADNLMEEMRVNKEAVRAFLERDVADFSYDELKTLHRYALMFYFHALSAEWD